MHEPAVGEDRDIVSDGSDLVEAVGDEHDRGAAFAQGTKVVEQAADLSGAEARGGFIQDEVRCPFGQGDDDLTELSVSLREVSRGNCQVDIDLGAFESVREQLVGRAATKDAPRADEQEVVEQREFTDKAQLLRNHIHAARFGFGTVAWCVDGIADGHGAGIRFLDSREDLREGGLAGAVLADEGVHSTGAHENVDAIECPRGAEGLRDRPGHQGPAGLEGRGAGQEIVMLPSLRPAMSSSTFVATSAGMAPSTSLISW